MSLEVIEADAREPVARFLLAIADDEFLTGQALTEWIAVGPTMEEDNALAEIAQDELGHARLWYELIEDYTRTNAGSLDGVALAAEEVDLDALAIGRPPRARRNSVLVEVDRHDFEVAIATNFLYDEAEARLLDALATGDIPQIADRAAQARSEEPFHVEHADRWLDRLVSTEEGRNRLSAAFETVLPLATDYFAFDEQVATPLVETSVLGTPLEELADNWNTAVRDRIDELPLEVDLSVLDERDTPSVNGRRGEHTDDLSALLERASPDDNVDHGIPRAVEP